jgi:hypothetical protein
MRALRSQFSHIHADPAYLSTPERIRCLNAFTSAPPLTHSAHIAAQAVRQGLGHVQGIMRYVAQLGLVSVLCILAGLASAVDLSLLHDVGAGFASVGRVVPDAQEGQVQAFLCPDQRQHRCIGQRLQ